MKCQQAVEDIMKEITDYYITDNDPPKNTIVVHNTFTQEWEMKPYYDLADKYAYTSHTIIVENRHGSKTIHDVPQHNVDRQRDRFEVTL